MRALAPHVVCVAAFDRSQPKKLANGLVVGGTLFSEPMENAEQDARLAQLTAEMAWLRRLARALIRNDDASDLAQDAWLVAAEEQPTDGRPLRPWLSRVVLNLSRMQARARQRRLVREEASASLVEAVPTPDDLVQRVELQRLVAGEVLRLAEPYRSTVLLHYFEELTCAEIARRLDLPEGTVRRRLKVALDELRARLDANDRKPGGLAALVPLAGVSAAPPKTASIAVGVIAMKKLVAVIVVLLLIVIGALLWSGRDNDDESNIAAGDRRHQLPGSDQRSDAPIPRIPQWFAARGISERRIAGRVTQDGQPVANASITLHHALTKAGLMPVVQRRTAADGTFDLGVHPAAVYQVVASAAGRTSAITKFDLADPTLRPPAERLHLILGSCASSVEGNVFDASGGPIPRARIRREGLIGVDADDSGKYKLCVPRGDSEVTYSADGYGAVLLTVDAQGAVQQDVVLVPEGVLSGRVIDAADSRPVADALVSVFPKPWGRNRGGEASVVTDADGRFRVTQLVPGQYRVWAFADGKVADGGSGGTGGVDALVEVGSNNEEITLQLSGYARVRGKVVSAGQPIAGARVIATRNSPSRRSEIGTSQADGSFVIERVPVGEVTFSAAPFRVKAPFSMNVASSAEIDDVVVEVEKLATIRGRVTRNSNPVPGASICCLPTAFDQFDRFVTDHDGRFEVRGVLPGTHSVGAQHDELGAFTEGSKVTVGPGDEREVNFELDLAATITGLVIDQHDKPVKGVFIRWTHEKTGDLGKAITDTQGRYRCAAMTGGGRYRASVYANSSEQSLFPTLDGTPYPVVDLKDGESVVDGIRVAIRAENHTISGRVIDREGGPIVDAQVRAVSMRPGDSPVFHSWLKVPLTFTDIDGGFALSGLTGGTYAVWAKSTDGGEGTTSSIAADTKDVVVTVARPESIDGALQGFPSRPIVYATAIDGSSLNVEAATVDRDSFRVLGLRPGKYLVNAQTSFEGDATIVEVGAGATTKVTLAAQGRGAIDGTVLDFRTRAPVPGVTCHVVPSAGGLQGMTAWDYRTAAKSDARGRIALDPAAAGDVIVSCLSSSRRISNPSIALSIKPGARASVVLWTAEMLADWPSTIGVEFNPGLPAPRIERMRANTSAALGGLLVGDLIVAIDGVAVDGLNWAGVTQLIDSRAAGTEVTVAVNRAGMRKTFTVKTEPRRYQ